MSARMSLFGVSFMALVLVQTRGIYLSDDFAGKMQKDTHSWFTNEVIPDSEDTIKGCGGKPADIIFAFDTSDEVSIGDFKNSIDFAKQLVPLFSLKVDKMRIGILAFGSNVHRVLHLERGTSRSDVLHAIDRVVYIGGSPNTASLLQVARNKIFGTVDRGAAQVMIVFTNGHSRNPTTTTIEAKFARKAGIYLYAVGLGRNLDKRELENIASIPVSEFVFTVKSGGLENALVKLLSIKQCNPRQQYGLEGDSKFNGMAALSNMNAF